MNYTVIVPFYNEEKNVSRFNNELIKNLEKSNTNNRIFEIGIYDHENKLLGSGTGHTKKKCEQIAAHNALLKMNIVNK